MARGLNKHTIIGNLGADPDVRYTQNDKVITRISVATTELVTSNGQSQEETEWHTVVLFGRRAEIGRDYLKKGSSVYIEGRVKTNRWNDRQTGQQRSVKEIHATDMRLLDNPSVQSQQAQQSQQRPPQQQRPVNQQSQQHSSAGGNTSTNFDSSPANI
jgi:single-strand DNA-binding protein